MNHRIMVVDDDEIVLKSIATLLKKKGYAVDEINNSRLALDRIREISPDLLVLDVRMPGIGGVELLSLIRDSESKEEKELKLPVIVLTGYADEDVPVQAIRLKADDYLMKPFDNTQLLQSIDRCLRIVDLEKEKIEYHRLLEEKVRERTRELQEAHEKLLDWNSELEKKVEEKTRELKEAHRRLLISEKQVTVGKMASGIAYELNSPIASIANVAFYLEKYLKKDDPKITEFLGILSSEISRMNRILSDLRNFSQAKQLNRQEVPVADLIDTCLKAAALGDRITVRRAFADNTPPAYVDAEKIKPVFVNLITNAREAMKDQGTLTITTEMKTGGDGRPYAVVAIADTGGGIAAEDIERIFDPLYTTKPKGIGLGLPIVKDLLDAHGGEVSVESTKGQGTVVTLLLPVKTK